MPDRTQNTLHLPQLAGFADDGSRDAHPPLAYLFLLRQYTRFSIGELWGRFC